MERLPEIKMRISVEPMEFLKRFEEIAGANPSLEVKSNYEGAGDMSCNVVSFADRAESEHEGLFAMCVHWERHGRDLRLQVAAHRWNPDPPTYDTYVDAAKRLFAPVIHAYNRKYGVRHQMRIQTREDLLPKMTPKQQEAFRHFVHTSNMESLHPLDWEKFYRFAYVSYRMGRFLDIDEIRWFCRSAGFSPQQSESLAMAFHHCYHFYEAFKKGRFRF